MGITNHPNSNTHINGNDKLDSKIFELFIFVSQTFNEQQNIETLSPDTPINIAIENMLNKNFSQIPIVVGSQVLGVFSYRSLAEKMMLLPPRERWNESLTVEDFFENINFSNINDELIPLIDEFELKDAILIGSEKNLQGIVTTIDVLRLFIKLSLPYIMLREIELTLRKLIDFSISNDELKICSEKVLKYYLDKGEEIPDILDKMTMNDCVNIITYGDSWPKFSPIFGLNRGIASTYLRPLPNLRNEIFHFKRVISENDFKILKRARDWLLMKYKKHVAQMEE